jgi:glycosyltransferase involved in cell wall biosynthesis
MDQVAVVLNVYKRASIFRDQLNAINNQTIKPIEILVWENGNETVPPDLKDGIKIARSNHNFGVWARFAYALNASADFICVLDDDTIPGNRWIENCLQTIKETPGLLGARGVIFDNKHSYSMNHDVGIYKPNEQTTQVDIVGHSWFFKKEWLYKFWSNADEKFQNELAGEDIHFAYVMQKFLGLPTLVPKHPIQDMSLWGANPKLSKKYGSGIESISISPSSLKKFENALKHYRNLGFLTLIEKDSKTGSKHSNLFYIIVQKFPRIMHSIAKIKNKTKKEF